QATEARLLSLMEKSTTLDQTLVLQRELTNVRGQIERLQGRQRALENQSDLATISLRITEPLTAPRPVEWTPALTFAQALAALTRIGQGLLVLVIWLGVFAPAYGIPIALVIWL